MLSGTLINKRQSIFKTNKIKTMFAKVLRGKDLPELEATLNEFLADCEIENNREKSMNDQRRLKVYNVQQFVIGEVDPKSVSIINQQPVPKFSFCLLLICGYE